MALELNPFAAITAGIDKAYSALSAALPTLLFVGGTFLIAYIVINIIKRVVKRVLDKVDFNPDLEYLAYRAVAWVSWFLVLVWLVGQLGQEEIFAALIAGGTLAGLAIALAVKDSLSDAVGGILLLQDKHFDLGDRVKIGSVEGKIMEVDLRKTRLQLDDGSIQIIAKLGNPAFCSCKASIQSVPDCCKYYKNKACNHIFISYEMSSNYSPYYSNRRKNIRINSSFCY